MTVAENCGAQGRTGACCMPAGHAGPHQRPNLTWDVWGGICGKAIDVGGPGKPVRPIACAYPEGHLGAHAWVGLDERLQLPRRT